MLACGASSNNIKFSRRSAVKDFMLSALMCGLGLSLFCEYLVHFVVLLSCSYPDLKVLTSNDSLRVMFLADTHVHIPNRNRDWSKLRQEWHMHRAFQTAQTYFKPEVVFFLGDIFDESQGANAEDFDVLVKRFKSLFRVKESQAKIHVVAGNHDLDLHSDAALEFNSRFEQAFGVKTAERFAMKGVHFVTVNSMAMLGDNCILCSQAKQELSDVSKELSCLKDDTECDLDYDYMNKYSRPILLQHFPLHRYSDSECYEGDGAPRDKKHRPFNSNGDCLSKNSTELLLDLFQPRCILSAHTHNGCKVYHGEEKVPEWSVSSFSWKNRNNPTFILGMITPHEAALSKCFTPEESTVRNTYYLGATCFIFFYLWRIA